MVTMPDASAALEPGRRPPAPGRLHLVQQFLNTMDVESATDELGDPRSAGGWLKSRGLMGSRARLTARDLERLVGFREDLRALALAHNGARAPVSSVRRVKSAARRAGVIIEIANPVQSRLVPLAPATSVDHAVAEILVIVHGAMANGTWLRLKACRNDACLWLFYDHSKNRSGTWCTMAVCGNVMKARAYRRRRKNH